MIRSMADEVESARPAAIHDSSTLGDTTDSALPIGIEAEADVVSSSLRLEADEVRPCGLGHRSLHLSSSLAWANENFFSMIAKMKQRLLQPMID